MNKNKKNNLNKVGLKFTSIALAITLSIGLSSSALANSAAVVPQLTVPQYTDSELKNANCNPEVWNVLVTNYLKKRGFERQVQGQIQVIDQANAAQPANAGNSGGSCWENALGSLNSNLGALDGLLSMFSGGFNWSAIANKVMSQVSDYACNQLTSYTGQINYGIKSKVGGVTNGINGGLSSIGVNNGVINVNVGDGINKPTGAVPATGMAPNVFNNATGAFK